MEDVKDEEENAPHVGTMRGPGPSGSPVPDSPSRGSARAAGVGGGSGEVIARAASTAEEEISSGTEAVCILHFSLETDNHPKHSRRNRTESQSKRRNQMNRQSGRDTANKM